MVQIRGLDLRRGEMTTTGRGLIISGALMKADRGQPPRRVPGEAQISADGSPSIHKQEQQDGPSLTTTSPGVYFSRAIASDARMPGCPMNNLHTGAGSSYPASERTVGTPTCVYNTAFDVMANTARHLCVRATGIG